MLVKNNTRRTWGYLGPVFGCLGPVLGCVGPVLGSLGLVLDGFGPVLGHLGSISGHSRGKMQKPHGKHRLWAENGLPPHGRGRFQVITRPSLRAGLGAVWRWVSRGEFVTLRPECLNKKQYRIDLECLIVQDGVQNNCKKQYKTHLGLS